MTEEFIDVESMLSHVGDFGRAQIILMILFSFINVLSAFHYFAQTFISVVPIYTCKYQCTSSEYFSDSSCNIIFESDNSTVTRPCNYGFNYSRENTYGYLGIIEEFDWICSNSWMPALGQSVFFMGSVIGTLCLGVLADIIGRLHVLVIANTMAFIGNVATVISGDIKIFALSRFIAGLATDSNFFMMYILVMEYVRPDLRTFGLNLCIGIFYCLACVIVPWTAVLLRTWKRFLICVSFPHLLVFVFYFLVPESAQWLIGKGKIEEAIECYKKIAKINGKQVDKTVYDSLKLYCEKHVSVKKHHESLWGLLKTPKLRKKTCILIFKSMVMTLGYDTISRNINGLGYSPFIIFSASSLTIFPACMFIMAVQDRIGRKALASSLLLFTGAFSIFSGIVKVLYFAPIPALILVLEITARFGITTAYNSGAQYAVELIPAVVRGQGVSAIHVTGYAASFFSPQILYLSNKWGPAPEMIVGTLLILGSISCLFLPETLNKTLPVTLQDGEEFGEDEGIFEFACRRVTTESRTALCEYNGTYHS